MLKMECTDKNEDGLDIILQTGYIFELIDVESAKILASIALEDWHHEAENLIGIFEIYHTSFTNEILYKMALQKYPNQYYGDEGEYIVTEASGESEA